MTAANVSRLRPLLRLRTEDGVPLRGCSAAQGWHRAVGAVMAWAIVERADPAVGTGGVVPALAGRGQRALPPRSRLPRGAAAAALGFLHPPRSLRMAIPGIRGHPEYPSSPLPFPSAMHRTRAHVITRAAPVVAPHRCQERRHTALTARAARCGTLHALWSAAVTPQRRMVVTNYGKETMAS